VNATGYGLTSGLESLDDREQELWRRSIRAGNLYINRPTTGAIVLRQPFGGIGKSAFGPGIKAGGPNYVVPLMRFSEEASPQPIAATPLRASEAHTNLESLRIAIADLHPLSPLSAADRDRLAGAIDSYLIALAEEFAVAHDDFRLLGEDNVRRYLPESQLSIRVHENDEPFEVFARACAAAAAGCRAVISSPRDLLGPAADAARLLDSLTDDWAASIEFVEETDAELAAALESGRVTRVRYAAPDRVPEAIRRAAAASLAYIADSPPLAEGRVELLWYLREQSISHVYHRYGNLGRRAAELRGDSSPIAE
jgi:RHH-type proline utilization regulon transcriptional repressor/proline dehydrogenase/delta 1-pyrroline-5-carboxylate dehydrogenase